MIKGVQASCLNSLSPIVKEAILLLSVLVPLVEFVNTTGGVNELDFTGVERMRGIGDLNLDDGVLNTINHEGFLCGSAGTGDEHGVV